PTRTGATVLIEGQADEVFGNRADAGYADTPQPIFAFQRYGAGMSAILGVHDTWLWQMHADSPLEDQTHELFWRQVLRWLVQDVPEPIQVAAANMRVAPSQPVELTARVVSEEYVPVNDAAVVARVT